MTLKRDRSVLWKGFGVAPYVGSPYSFDVDNCGVMFNKYTRFDGTEPVVIGFHGHSGTGLAMGVPFLPFGVQLVEMARHGFIVVSIGAGGIAGWPSPIVEQIILNAYTWATSPRLDPDFATGLGGKPGKVGVYGYSMGGGNAITFAKNHPDKVAACMVLAPAISLDEFYTGSTLAEIDILFASAWANKVGASQTIPAAGTVDLLVDDTTAIGLSGFTSGNAWRLGSGGALGFNFTGIDGTHLLGASRAAGAITATANNVLIVPLGAYHGDEGFDATNDAALGRYSPGSYDIPTRLAHGSADTTVIPSTIATFLGLADNPIIEETLLLGADHTNLFQYLASDRDVPWLAEFLN